MIGRRPRLGSRRFSILTAIVAAAVVVSSGIAWAYFSTAGRTATAAFTAGTISPDFNAVSTVSSSATWAVGSDCTVFFYNGSSWIRDNNVPTTCLSNGINLTGVSVISATEGYIAGSNTNSNATLLTCSASCTSATANWVAGTVPETTATVTGLSTGVTKEVLVTANDSSGGMIWGCHNATPCTTLTNVTPGAHLANVTLNAVTMIEQVGHALAVGVTTPSTASYMEACSNNCDSASTNWAKVTTLPASATGPLTGVVQEDGSTAIAVGADAANSGIVLGCTTNCLSATGTWAQEAGPTFATGVTPTQVTSLKAGATKNGALMVGTGGHVWYCSAGTTNGCTGTASSWVSETSGTSKDLNGVDGVAGAGGNLGFSVAVGDAATVVVATTAPTSGWSTTTLSTTPPAAPTGPVTLANGQGVGSAYINNSTKSSVSVTVAGVQVISGSDSVIVSLSDGTNSVTGSTAASSGTVTVTGINASTLVDGTNNITISAVEADASNNQSSSIAAATTYSKDTTVPAPTNVTLGGNGDGIANIGDTVTIVYNEKINASSFCSAWSDNTNPSTLSADNDVTVTVSSAAQSVLTVSSASCTLNLGSVNLGRQYATAAETFFGAAANASKITWTPSTSTLVITLGAKQSGTASSAQAAAVPKVTGSSAATDLGGNAMSTTAVNGTNSKF